MSWLPRPALRGVGCLAVGVGLLITSIITQSWALAPIFTLVATTWIATLAVAFLRKRRCSCIGDGKTLAIHTAVLPSIVQVGGQSTLRLTIVNRSNHRLGPFALHQPNRWLRLEGDRSECAHFASNASMVRESLSKDPYLAPISGSRYPIDALTPGGLVTATFEIPTNQRGVFRLEPATVWVSDPFGFWGYRVANTSACRIVIFPASEIAIASELLRSRAQALGESSVRYDHEPFFTKGSEGTGELYDLRPYVPGDRLHLIHWPSLARYGTALVRTFEPDDAEVVQVLFDDRVITHRAVEFEAMLSLAFALVENAFRKGKDVELVTLSGSKTILTVDESGRTELIWFLAVAQPRQFSLNSIIELVEQSRAKGIAPLFNLITSSSGVKTLPAILSENARLVIA